MKSVAFKNERFFAKLDILLYLMQYSKNRRYSKVYHFSTCPGIIIDKSHAKILACSKSLNN